MHRLLELYAHTLPAFGHVRHLNELLFESAHQPLKRAMLRSNHNNPQLSAVRTVVLNHWQARLALDVRAVGAPRSEWDESTCRYFLRRLVGRATAGVCNPRCYARVRSVFVPPVLHQLGQARNRLGCTEMSKCRWVCGRNGAGASEHEGTYLAEISHQTFSKVQSLFTAMGENTYSPILLHEAVRVAQDAENGASGSEGAGSIRATVRVGHTLRGLATSLHDLRLEDAPMPSLSGRVFGDFYILSLFSLAERVVGPLGCSRTLMAAVLPLRCTHRDMGIMSVALGEEPMLVVMDGGVSETLSVHCCRLGGCVATGHSMRHELASPEHYQFYVYGREEGFPARRG